MDLGLCLRVLPLVLVLVHAVPEKPRPLSCKVSALPGGLTQYQLHPEPKDCVEPGWADRDNTVLTLEGDFMPDLVQSLTNQTLVTKKCFDFMRYISECPGFVEANCSFDCRLLPKASDVLKPANDICFGKWCLKTTVLLFILLGLGFLLLVTAAVWCFYKNKKRCDQRDLNVQEEEQGPLQKDPAVPLQELRPLRA